MRVYGCVWGWMCCVLRGRSSVRTQGKAGCYRVVTEAVKKLPRVKEPGVDNLHPDMLKTLDIVRLL